MSASRNKKQQEPSPAARMRSLFAAGDVKAARQMAAGIAADAASPEELRGEALRLQERTEIDGRALAIGALAVALAAIYIGSFLL